MINGWVLLVAVWRYRSINTPCAVDEARRWQWLSAMMLGSAGSLFLALYPVLSQRRSGEGAELEKKEGGERLGRCRQNHVDVTALTATNLMASRLNTLLGRAHGSVGCCHTRGCVQEGLISPMPASIYLVELARGPTWMPSCNAELNRVPYPGLENPETMTSDGRKRNKTLLPRQQG